MQYRIQFMDEAPAFGSGSRGVAVVKQDRRYITLYDIGSGIKKRFLLAWWYSIPKHVVKNNRLTGEIEHGRPKDVEKPLPPEKPKRKRVKIAA